MALLNKFGRMQYPDGDIYEGDFKAGLRHGTGTYFKQKSHTRYEGQWHEDAMHGEGIFYYAMEKYGGQWENNKRHGKGYFLYENGSRYDGEWVNDLRSGQGEMHYHSGGNYKGTWKDDVREGEGKMNYCDDSVYEGHWVDDLRQGHGKNYFTDPEGRVSIYEGEFYYDLPHGRGVLQSAEDQSTYTGDFARGYKEGEGKMETPTETFEGLWRENKRVEGIRSLKNGDDTRDWVEYVDNVMVHRRPYHEETNIMEVLGGKIPKIGTRVS